MASAKQSSILPTRKLTIGASLAAVIGTYAGPAFTESWPQIAPAILAGPAVTGMLAAALSAVLAAAVAWFVPDAPNQVAR